MPTSSPIVLPSPQNILADITSPKVLILRIDRIGDVLVSLPFMHHLRAALPQSQIDIVLGKRNEAAAPLLERFIDNILVYRKSLVSLLRLISRIRDVKYDLVIDMMDNPSRTTAMLTRLSAARYTLGFQKTGQSFYSHTVPLPDRSQVHIVECMARLLFAVGLNSGNLDLSIHIDELNNYRIQQRNLYCVPEDECMVLVNLSAGKESVVWESENYVELIQRLKAWYLRRKQSRVRIWISAAMAHSDLAAAIATRCDVGRLSPTEHFPDFARFVAASDVIITPDTSVAHIAAAQRIPAVVLYAQPHPGRMPWYPYNSRHIAVVARDDKGLSTVSVDEVFEAASKLIDEV